jgi:hypothetical protein
MAGDTLYALNKGDREIFRLAAKDPNVFTKYYLASETTGTWWLPGAETQKWKQGYDQLLKVWTHLNKPNRFEHAGNPYRIVWEHEQSANFPGDPAFHHQHGFIFLPYQRDIHLSIKPFTTLLGGFGSGKTLGCVASLLVYAAILPSFRAFALAPLSIQSMEVYKLALELLQGTLYEERFLIRASERPFPHLLIGNDLVGVSRIECYPILNNAEKLRTLTGDMAIIDQSERIENGGLTEVIRSVGTRFRGRVAKGGRSRLGKLIFVANSGDNQELWDLYDMQDEDPKNYVSLSPSSYDNIWLTDADLRRFELQVGSSEELRQIYLFGKRPMGNGEHFSRDVLERMQEPNLDRVMNAGLAKQAPGYIKMEIKSAGVYEWMLPPQPDRNYLVISDPGTKDPPHRDSPPILVWDITDFPGTYTNPRPAFLVGFVWVFGKGKITNWATRYAELVNKYKAIGRNGFDATAFQSGYDQWINILTGLYPEKINLAGNNKFLCLNAAKMLTSRQMMKMPKAVSMIYSQLARYVYPEGKKDRQDLVMAFAMSAWWMQRLYYIEDDRGGEGEDAVVEDLNDRYRRSLTSRYKSRLHSTPA